MGFPRGRGGFRGGGRGGGGRGRGRGGYGGYDTGPPDTVTEIGLYLHPCESDLVVKCTNDHVPYFNAPIYLENKSQIGKVDEIFGPMNDFYFSVKLSQNMNASSFEKTQKFFIDPAKLLPLSRFLAKPTRGRGVGGRGGRGGTPRGRGGRGGRGGFSSPRGGRGFSRGGGRGFSGGRGFRGGGRGRY